MIVSFVEFGEKNRKKIAERTGKEVAVLKPGEGHLPEDTEILFTTPAIDPEWLEPCRRLEWIYVPSAGVEKLPFAQLKQRKIRVAGASGMHPVQMAEQVLGMMIAFSRGLIESFPNKERKIWGKGYPLGTLEGKTLLIVGAGKIGREVARKAKAFDMRVVGLKKHVQPMEHFDDVRDLSTLRQSLGEVDFILLLLPLTDETRFLFGAGEFAAMKRSAVFLNFSRGDTVDEAAMIAALKDGVIAGAGLDVFHSEPLEQTSPLWEMHNVVITPHNAGVVDDYTDRAVDLFLNNYDSWRQNGVLVTEVDLDRQY